MFIRKKLWLAHIYYKLEIVVEWKESQAKKVQPRNNIVKCLQPQFHTYVQI